MKLIKEESFEKILAKKYSYEFELSEDGVFLIEIIASAKSWWQNFKSLRSFLKDDDIALVIDKLEVTTLKSADQDVRPVWNGNGLKGLLKTVLIGVNLKKGRHFLYFTPNQTPYLKSIAISRLENDEDLTYIPISNNPAQAGHGRPWLSYVLVNLPIQKTDIRAKVNKNIGDDDDLKLIIDGEVQKNYPPAGEKKSHTDWFWCGKILKGKSLKFSKDINWKGGLHYLDLWADESPFLEKIELTLAKNKKPRIPTVDDPIWTGNFYDDSEQMILARTIFGEARGLSEKGKIAVGWTIKNRVIDARWPDNYHGVILQSKQYSAFIDDNLIFIKNPFVDKQQINSWYECYKIAGRLIKGDVPDPTNGANHYYSDFIKPPYWTKDKNAHFIIKIDNTLFYEIVKPNKGTAKFFAIILLTFVIMTSLLIFQRFNTAINAKGSADTVEIKYRHYFINPKDEEINVIYLDQDGKITGSKQLTFNNYPKVDLRVFDFNNMLGYFQYVHERDTQSPIDEQEYYNNYIKLMIKKGEDEEPYEVYRGDYHTSYWEWDSNKSVTVYISCGTHCLYYKIININTKKVEKEGIAYI